MIQVTISTDQAFRQIGHRLSLLTDRNLRYVTARSMTTAAKAAQAELKAEMQSGRYISNPTPFTLNSTFVRFAKPSDLSVEVGFKEFAGKGTAAGKYLNPLATGTPRAAKRSERSLQMMGLIPPGRFMVPTGVAPLTLNAHGNLTGGTYTQVLSRLKALGQQGYLGNVSGSARSQAKKRARDYFIGRPGGLPLGIYARVGTRPKYKKGGQSTTGLPTGFHTVFYITTQPQYRLIFPISRILSDEFAAKWPTELRRLVDEELRAIFGR